MINKIGIENFQGHKKTDLKFHEGVNVIKGISDGGKSSIIRALRWALFNRPNGFSFKSHFSGKKEDTKVGIIFSDNIQVIRKRGKECNEYFVGRIREDAQHLEAMRGEIPREVTQATQIEEINIQSQNDRYFLLAETSGTVAKKLNKIAKLEVIDTCQKKINRIVSSTEVLIKGATAELNEMEYEITSYKGLENVGALIDECLKLKQKAESDQRNFEVLTSIREDITEKELTIDRTQNWLEVNLPYQELRTLINLLTEKVNTREELRKIIEQVQLGHDTIKNTKEWLEVEIHYDRLGNKILQYQDISTQRRKLETFIQLIEGFHMDADEHRQRLQFLIKEYEETLKEAGVCPICGSKT